MQHYCFFIYCFRYKNRKTLQRKVIIFDCTNFLEKNENEKGNVIQFMQQNIAASHILLLFVSRKPLN